MVPPFTHSGPARAGGVRWARIALSLVVLALLCTVAAPVGAQHRAWFPSRELLPDLLAGPRDPVNSARLILNTESPNAFGSGFEGEAAFGIAFPVLLLDGTDTRDALVLGLEAGVFGRFSFHLRPRDLITSDWVFALPVVLHRGDHWVRLRYHHMSGHLGDEYGQRFEVEPFNYSRDAVDLMGLLRVVPLVSVYGGADWAYKVHPDGAGAWSARAGMEVMGSTAGSSATPYGAVDVQLEQQSDWDPRINIQVGVMLRGAVRGRDLRWALEFLTGPSPQGQFFDRRVTHLTIGVYLRP